MSETNVASEWYYVRNWWKYQHYHDRNAPWIKLHRSIQTDPDFQKLSEIDQWRLVRLWLDASEIEGRLPRDCAYIARRLGIYHRQSVRDLLARLEASGLISQQDVRGHRRESASPRQRQRQRQIDATHPEAERAAPAGRNGHAKNNGAAPDSTALFDRLWQLYPEKGKRAGVDWTAQIFLGLEIHDKPDDILAGLALWIESTDWQRDGGKFVPSLENFLRKQLWRIKPKNESLNPYMEYYPVEQALKDLEDYDAKRQGRVRKTG